MTDKEKQLKDAIVLTKMGLKNILQLLSSEDLFDYVDNNEYKRIVSILSILKHVSEDIELIEGGKSK